MDLSTWSPSRKLDWLIMRPERALRIALDRSGSPVQLDHVAVLDPMSSTDLLSVESALAPDSRIAERPRNVLVHEPRDIFDRLAATQREWSTVVRRASGRLGVHADDAEPLEEPATEPAESASRGGGHCERGIAKPCDLDEYAELGVRIGDAICLVREQQRRPSHCER